MKKIDDYSLSFTAASLMFFETEQIARLFLQYNDWSKVQKIVIDDNYIQKGTISTRKREFAEIKKRLIDLNFKELEFIANCSTDELKLFCLYICTKTYRLIYEFIVEVVREKYLNFNYTIYDSDYTNFFESKKLSSQKLQNITEKTTYKVKQVIFRMLEQSTLIDSAKNKNIQKPYVSKELEDIMYNNPKYLACYLYSDNDINSIKESLNV